MIFSNGKDGGLVTVNCMHLVTHLKGPLYNFNGDDGITRAKRRSASGVNDAVSRNAFDNMFPCHPHPVPRFQVLDRICDGH